jgi:hypothetical protein
VWADWKQQVGPETTTDRSFELQAHFLRQARPKVGEKVVVCRVGIVCTSRYQVRCYSECRL